MQVTVTVDEFTCFVHSQSVGICESDDFDGIAYGHNAVDTRYLDRSVISRKVDVDNTVEFEWEQLPQRVRMFRSFNNPRSYLQVGQGRYRGLGK